MDKAVVLLSGGLDSATALYYAKKKYRCSCLIFDYGQRHRKEIACAKKVARSAQAQHEVIKIALPWKGSALLDEKINLPASSRLKVRKAAAGIPDTYVPARNIIFLSLALSFAEAIGAKAIFIGAHDQDYSGYPDCRPEFYRAFAGVIAQGTRAGVEKKGITVQTPLIGLDKAGIIKLGMRLGVPFGLTWSCYQGGKFPCGKCDSCYYRVRGFARAGIADPLIKQERFLSQSRNVLG